MMRLPAHARAILRELHRAGPEGVRLRYIAPALYPADCATAQGTHEAAGRADKRLRRLRDGGLALRLRHGDEHRWVITEPGTAAITCSCGYVHLGCCAMLAGAPCSAPAVDVVGEGSDRRWRCAEHTGEAS